jgi:hypothetical protein
MAKKIQENDVGARLQSAHKLHQLIASQPLEAAIVFF